jgi:tetratricopeptide (TPR) repeat protein
MGIAGDRSRTLLLAALICAAPLRAAAGPVGQAPEFPDTTSTSQAVRTFRGLAPAARAERSARAAVLLARRLGDSAGDAGRGSVGGALLRGVWRHRKPYGIGNEPLVAEILRDLTSAVELDPGSATAWTALGLLRFQLGDDAGAAAALATAVAVLDPGAAPDAAGHDALLREALTGLALACRRLGLAAEGLAAAERGLRLSAGDPQLTLARGLLLAAVGRDDEAMSLAVTMPAVRFRHQTSLGSGWVPRPSAYANRWLKSQALLARGEVDLACHVLGDLDEEAAMRMPLDWLFWQDAGELFEIAGDARAARAYDLAYARHRLRPFMPYAAGCLGPVVLDCPDPELPYFTAPGGGLAAGSPFSYVAAQINQVAEGSSAAARDVARARAGSRLAALEARGQRPDVCRALRGRLLLLEDHRPEARRELQAACDAFAARGVTDPGTCILLGQLELLSGRSDLAGKLFAAAVAAAPDGALAWRELGIALSRCGDPERALTAMDRALDIDPASAAGLYNRALLHHGQGRHEAALADLEAAWRLDPDDARILNLLQVIANARRAAAQ